jgi:type III pantothenate kinase
MKSFVVDVGNSRIKWGDWPLLHSGVLPRDDPHAWTAELGSVAGTTWTLAGVNPPARDRFRQWLEDQGARTQILDDYRALPLGVNVRTPERLGIDRLLGCVAASRLGTPGRAKLTIDVGTALTINLLDEAHVFQGGAIAPGPRLMLEALHGKTAALPRVNLEPPPEPELPGKDTVSAIQLGIISLLRGAVDHLRRSLCPGPHDLFLTGGGVSWLAPHTFAEKNVTVVPNLNLLGLGFAQEGELTPSE